MQGKVCEQELKGEEKERKRFQRCKTEAYSADDGIVVCEMSFAVLATEYTVGVQVDVVCEPHSCCLLFRRDQLLNLDRSENNNHVYDCCAE